jgi:oligopeptide transport system substrate-binding protein
MLAAGAALLTASNLAGKSGSAATSVREGGVLRIDVPGFGFDYIDPALALSPGSVLAETVTCARLFSYPDRPLPAGSRLVPEVAVGYPKVSRNGRTYTFTIRRGFRFSTGERITGASFAHEFDRVLNPTMHSPGSDFVPDLAGAHAVAGGRKLVVSLKRRVPDLLARLALPFFCPVPRNLPIDPEGVRAPLPGSGPYFFSTYVPGREVVIKRNRFYRGGRPHHVDGFVIRIGSLPPEIIPRIDRGETDWTPAPYVAREAYANLAQKYGVGKSRFFIRPAPRLLYVIINTSGRLFRNNLALRRAVNFAIDRPALVRVYGRYGASPSDQYLPRAMPGFRDSRIYPLNGPDLKKARALAKGRTRGGKALLYAIAPPPQFDLLDAQIIKQNLAKIGLDVTIKQFPVDEWVRQISAPGAAFDLATSHWTSDWLDPYAFLNVLFEGSLFPPKGANISRLNSRRYNRLLENASRLSGSARYRAYGQLDISLARKVAPAAAFGNENRATFVSARVGCKTFNANDLDLAAVCLKR